MSDIETRLATLERDLDDLRSREAIREILHRYCRGVDRLDAEIMKSCYHDDAYDTHWFGNGPAQSFSDWVIAEVLPHAHTTVHSITNELIEIDGDRAFVESHVHVLHEMAVPGQNPDKPYLHQLVECRYVDIFERRDGVWKIFYRHVVADNTVEFEVPVYPVQLPEEAVGKRDKTDPVYTGFDVLKLRPADIRVNFFAPFVERNTAAAE
ncbi:hypothetical protein ASG84_08910 [Rhodococcus sp. Leaf278]|uniref:nuclear transport factor 2 family protein n=1 Tax=Rhodococcus sp. Leaf278 TaxID=1736319 RepID=UPI00070E24E9|nr:nuclear transport factor 2 family protein [Rhodococcus sp. Leaf278]KQU47218.1 hypothetical protein ASG84_08910 [Rhodococcus sp. Leaf278]